jgi:predicted MFS family arabinose efflux permease
MTALVIALVLNLVCLLARDFGQLLALRAVLGATAAIAGPCASAIAAGLVPPERRGSAMATVTGGMTIAFMLGIPMGSVVGAAFGWRATFGLAALLALIALTCVTLFTPQVRPPPAQAGGKLAIGAALPLWASTFLAFGANMTISTYLAPIIRLQTGVVGAGVGAFQMMIGVGSFVGLWLGGRAADRGDSRWHVAGAFLTLATAAALHEFELRGGAPEGAATYAVVGLAIFIAATSLFSIMPVVQTKLVATLPEAAPLALAVNGSSASLGQALGGALGGLVLASVGGQSIPLAAIVIALIGASFWTMTVARAKVAA